MTADSPRVLVPPPLIFAGLTGIVLTIDGHLHEFGIPQLFSVLMAMVALLLIGSALNLFRRKNTRPEPWQPSSTLVVAGTYRFTRNPMYLGMAMLSLAVAIYCWSMAASILTFVAVLVVDRFVIRREEAYLNRRFGEAYRTYKQQVRRWL